MAFRVYNLDMSNGRRLRYKGMSVNMFGLPSFGDSKKENKKIIPKREYLRSFISEFKKDAHKIVISTLASEEKEKV